MDLKSKLIGDLTIKSNEVNLFCVDNLIRLESLEKDGTSFYDRNEGSTIDKANGYDIRMAVDVTDNCIGSQCEIDLIEVDENWVDENCQHSEDGGSQNSSEVELIEVDEHWVDEKCQYGDDVCHENQNWLNETEVEIGVDANSVDINCQYGANAQERWSGDTEGNGSGEIELIEVDENWVDINCQYDGNGQASLSGVTEANGSGDTDFYIQLDKTGT